jgi:hypothetical protein
MHERANHTCKGCGRAGWSWTQVRQGFGRLIHHDVTYEDAKFLCPLCWSCCTKFLRLKAARGRKGLTTDPRPFIDEKFFMPRSGPRGLGVRYQGKTLKDFEETL